jgi:hypothetical protein
MYLNNLVLSLTLSLLKLGTDNIVLVCVLQKKCYIIINHDNLEKRITVLMAGVQTEVGVLIFLFSEYFSSIAPWTSYLLS